MLNPPNLHVAFGLAKMQEENIAALKRMARVGQGPNRVITGPSSSMDNHVLVPI